MAFLSLATNLAPPDATPATADVFRHEPITRATLLVSKSTTGEQADRGGLGDPPRISGLMSRANRSMS